MVSGTLAPLYTVFGLKLGCSGAAAPIGDSSLEIFRPFVLLGPLPRYSPTMTEKLFKAGQE